MRGLAMAIADIPSTITVKSANTGVYAAPAMQGPYRTQIWGTRPESREWLK